MTSLMVLSLLTLLLVKHFIIDFPFQVPYHYQNKGKYGHLGGIHHAGLHGIGTILVLIFFTTPILVVILAIVDMVVHYHIDWAKMNINSKLNLKPDNSEKFWWLLGLDQLLHHLTYVAIVWVVISKT